MVYVHFECSEALFENGTVPPEHVESLTIGPFDFVQMTYEWFRVGPEGDHVAVHKDGLWYIVADEDRDGPVMNSDTVRTKDDLIFSDITINTEEGRR